MKCWPVETLFYRRCYAIYCFKVWSSVVVTSRARILWIPSSYFITWWGHFLGSIDSSETEWCFSNSIRMTSQNESNDSSFRILSKALMVRRARFCSVVAEICLDCRDFERLSVCAKRSWLKWRPKKNLAAKNAGSGISVYFTFNCKTCIPFFEKGRVVGEYKFVACSFHGPSCWTKLHNTRYFLFAITSFPFFVVFQVTEHPSSFLENSLWQLLVP